MRIVWRARARADILAIVAYIARDSQKAAFETHDQIVRMVGLLSLWPELGRKGRKADLRELVIAHTPYIVIYRRTKRQVTILRVFHAAQNR
jgi:toxin ParE1/3/4